MLNEGNRSSNIATARQDFHAILSRHGIDEGIIEPNMYSTEGAATPRKQNGQ
jgi:hypothetical protein